MNLTIFGALGTESPQSKSLPSSFKIEDIPEELVLEIFIKMPAKEVYNYARVCKQWSRLVQDDFLWTRLAIDALNMGNFQEVFNLAKKNIVQETVDKEARCGNIQAKLYQVRELMHGTKEEKSEGYKLLQTLATEGSIDAQFALGNFKNGKRLYFCKVKRNIEEAIGYYKKAAMQGHTESMFALYKIHINKNYGEALSWLLAAGKRNHLGANFLLGNLMRTPLPSELSEELSTSIAAYKDEGRESLSQLAYILGSLDDTKKTMRKDVVDVLERQITENTEDQMVHLSNIFQVCGISHPLSKKILELYEQKAAEDKIHCQYALASYYTCAYDECEIEPNLPQARYWYERIIAIEPHSQYALLDLCEMYVLGIGGERDDEKAVYCFSLIQDADDKAELLDKFSEKVSKNARSFTEHLDDLTTLPTDLQNTISKLKKKQTRGKGEDEIEYFKRILGSFDKMHSLSQDIIELYKQKANEGIEPI